MIYTSLTLKPYLHSKWLIVHLLKYYQYYHFILLLHLEENTVLFNPLDWFDHHSYYLLCSLNFHIQNINYDSSSM